MQTLPRDAERRPPWRRRLVAIVVVGALVAHLAFLVHGSFDPLKRFGFRPYDTSDTWQADIVRVDADGEKHAIDDGTWAYRWNDLVPLGRLGSPWSTSHANAGADATLERLDRALDWIVQHTAADTETVRLEATVTIVRAGRQPETHVVVSEERDLSR